LCKKTARQVNVLGRLSNQLNHDSKLRILHSFILSNFSYCSLIYHESGFRNRRKLEKIQERALRVIFKDFTSSYSCLLDAANIRTLYASRCKKVLEHVFKAIHNLSPLFPPNSYEIKSVPYDMRQVNILRQPNFNTVRYGKNSMKYQACKLWNVMPNNLTEIDDFKDFQKALCRCGFNFNEF